MAEKVSRTEAKTTGPKLWTVLLRACHSVTEILEASVAEEGLCLSDFAVLEVLLHKGSLPISTIGEKVLLRNASMTSAVDRLIKQDLVVRAQDGCDRRVRQVSLTSKGRTLITGVYHRHAAEIERMMAGLNADERDRMRDGLKTIGHAAKAVSDERAAARKGRRAEVPPAPDG